MKDRNFKDTTNPECTAFAKYTTVPEGVIILCLGVVLPLIASHVLYLYMQDDTDTHIRLVTCIYPCAVFAMMSYLAITFYMDTFILSEDGIEMWWLGMHRGFLKWSDIPYICRIRVKYSMTILIFKKHAQFEKVITTGPQKGQFPESSIRNRKTNIEILGSDYFVEFIEQYYGPLDYDCKRADG